jgi:hypothetical protein
MESLVQAIASVTSRLEAVTHNDTMTQAAQTLRRVADAMDGTSEGSSAGLHVQVALPQQPIGTQANRRAEVATAALPAVIAAYRMNRQLDSVHQIWTEYKGGLDGGPAVWELEASYGRSWRKSNTETKFFSPFACLRRDRATGQRRYARRPGCGRTGRASGHASTYGPCIPVVYEGPARGNSGLPLVCSYAINK